MTSDVRATEKLRRDVDRIRKLREELARLEKALAILDEEGGERGVIRGDARSASRP